MGAWHVQRERRAVFQKCSWHRKADARRRTPGRIGCVEAQGKLSASSEVGGIRAPAKFDAAARERRGTAAKRHAAVRGLNSVVASIRCTLYS